jgi:hypothetical protein
MTILVILAILAPVIAIALVVGSRATSDESMILRERINRYSMRK